MLLASFLVASSLSMSLTSPAEAVQALDERTAMFEDGVGELTVVATPIEIGTVALGAVRVPVLKLEVSASCTSSVRLQEITLHHEGLGSSGDIDAVFIGAEYRRVSRASRIERSGEVRLRLQNVEIPACEVLPMTVYVNLSRDAAPAGEHALTLRSPSDVSSAAKSVTLTSAEATSSTVVASPRSFGAVTVRFLPVPGRPRYGRSETVARIQISADNVGSHVLKEITLMNTENARNYDFLDFELTDMRGTVLTRPAQHMDGRDIRLFFDPTYILEKGQTRVFLLKAKLNGSITKKVNFILEEEADLVSSPYRARR